MMTVSNDCRRNPIFLFLNFDRTQTISFCGCSGGLGGVGGPAGGVGGVGGGGGHGARGASGGLGGWQYPGGRWAGCFKSVLHGSLSEADWRQQ